MMKDIISKEETRLGLGSSEFMKRHNEIIKGCDELINNKKNKNRREVNVWVK